VANVFFWLILTDNDTDTYLPIKLECNSQTALGSVGNGNWKCDKVSIPKLGFPMHVPLL
jgi:hypothetical protein